MRTVFALALSLVCAAGLAAREGGIYLSTTLITLDGDEPLGAITVRNDTDRAVTFQVRCFAWSNTADASIHLEATEHIVVYPATIALAAGETRRVRIGSRIPAGPTERAYRLILDETPPAAASGGVGLATRMQFSLPVFVPSRKRSASVSMPAPSVEASTLRLALANAGSLHVTPQAVNVRGVDETGGTVWTRSFKPWYLLAGESRQYEAALSSSECLRTHRLVADAVFAEGSKLTLREEALVTGASCQGR